jgi:DNA-directed RNA polymerase III subunit RPC3
VTAQVYGAMLSALGKKLSNCQIDADDESDDMLDRPSVTTYEIFEHLKPSLDVFTGIGQYAPEKINVQSAEKIQLHAPSDDADNENNGMALEDDDDDEEDRDVRMQTPPNGINSNGTHDDAEIKITPSHNGSRESKVKFADKIPTKAERMQQMRQHLLLLTESGQQFVRHCGTRDQGEWTVDFELLIPKLKLMEIDALVEQSFGRQGLRLVKILRAKGKVDDKTLPILALMNKKDVLVKMVEMELAGYLEVQEVPRDNNRTAARTLFFWFFDQERTVARILDNTYKAMVRHLQRLEVERRRAKGVLAFVERKDVQGKEEEYLTGYAYGEYRAFLDIEGKLLGQVSRLDDVVGVLRDY